MAVRWRRGFFSPIAFGDDLFTCCQPSVCWVPAGFVKLPGVDVVLGDLRPDVKAQVWRGMKALDPGRAEGLKNLASDPVVQSLQIKFQVGPVITEAEFKQFMQAGRT